jgi:hypothetical protein
MEFYQALQICCLRSVMTADNEYEIRKIFRWYSKEFHTPLHEVEILPLDDVLVSFWESHYEEYDDEARQQLLKEFLTPIEEKKKKLDQEELEIYDFLEFSRQEIKKEPEFKEVKMKFDDLEGFECQKA